MRSITLRAMLLAVLVGQEYILSGIPQVQLTVILIIVYAHFLRYRELVPLVVAYALLDNLLMGSFSLLYTPSMLIIWPVLAIVARALRERSDALNFVWAVFFAFLYSWSFIPASIVVMHLDTWAKVWTYITFDFPFEVALAVNSIVTFLVLYRPLKELLLYLFKRVHPNDSYPDEMSL